MNNTTSEDDQYTFDQNAANKLPVSGMDGRLFERTICYNCQTYGHYSGNCTEPSIRGNTLVYDGFVMTQMVCKKYSPISKEWILLDTQSTVSVFNNKQFLTNIRESKETLHAIINGGYQDSHYVGEFPNLGTVWYNHNSIANILSMKEVQKVFRVTMDTSIKPTCTSS